MIFSSEEQNLLSVTCQQIHKLAGSTELPPGRILYHGDFHYEAGPVSPFVLVSLYIRIVQVIQT